MKNQNSNTPCFLKAFEIESEATKPLFNGSSLFEANL
ncbi:anthranilate synthase component I [Helicobacter pylori]